MVAYSVSVWCISAETNCNQITPIMIRSNDSSTCPSEILRDNAMEFLKNIVSARLLSTKPPADVTTTTSITTGTTTTSTTTTTSSTTTTNMPPVVLLQSSLFGRADAGNPFDDYSENIAGIATVTIRSGTIVDSIQVTYQLKNGNSFTAPMHGGPGGVESSFTLGVGEKLTRMDAMSNSGFHFNNAISMLTFYSNTNNVYGPYGSSGDSTQYSVQASEIVAFFGRARDFGSTNDFLDAIGVHYIP